MNLSSFFRGSLFGKIIVGFPYPEKQCTYCNKKCTLVDAIHVTESPEIFKALYICMNDKCDAFDEPARKAYAKVYYSSEEAYEKLELHRIWFDRKKLD
jgi:hypothetical protein